MRWYKLYLWLFSVFMMALAGYVWAAPARQISNIDSFVTNLRSDMEQLASAIFGGPTRPTGWIASISTSSPTYVSDLWFNNELLATELFGSEERPDNWIGVTAPNAGILLRNVRHDLEVAADAQFGRNTRPDVWLGADAIFRCDRALQNVVTLLGRAYDAEFQTLPSAVDYCRAVAIEAEEIVIQELLDSPDFQAQIPNLILAVRGDLERLADERLGLDQRPEGYFRNVDVNSPSFVSDLYLDLEALATTLLGSTERPEGWLGTVTQTLAVSYRNLRHDVELLADETLGVGTRPRGWQGTDKLATCNPSIQDLVLLAEREYAFSNTVDPTAVNYCEQVNNAASLLVETPPEDVVSDLDGVEQRLLAESNFAFSYLDVSATQYMGIMPGGTRFRAWYRQFGESNMMFVSGDDFALFVDQRFTTLPLEVFDTLPTLEGVRPLTFCDANWCNGPGPTPTSTGSALALLLTTPLPTLAAGTEGEVVEIEDKTQVSWNNIRVTYLADNAAARTAQVTLEICQDSAQTVCEPVLRVVDNATGAPKPVLSQSSGLNVFEFQYGYTSNLQIVGATLFSPDVWISDPTIR
jgi:hypothetical protein